MNDLTQRADQACAAWTDEANVPLDLFADATAAAFAAGYVAYAKQQPCAVCEHPSRDHYEGGCRHVGVACRCGGFVSPLDVAIRFLTDLLVQDVTTFNRWPEKMRQQCREIIDALQQELDRP